MQADKMSADNGNYEMNDFDEAYYGGNNFPNAPYDSNSKNDSSNSLWSPYDGNNFGNNSWDGGSSESSRSHEGPKYDRPNYNGNRDRERDRDPWMSNYEPPSKHHSEPDNNNYPPYQRRSRHSNGPDPNFPPQNRNYDHNGPPPSNNNNGRFPSVPANPVSYKKPAFVPQPGGGGPSNGPSGPSGGPNPYGSHRGQQKPHHQGKFYPPPNDPGHHHHPHAVSPSYGNNSPYPTDRSQHHDRSNSLPLAPTMQQQTSAPPPPPTQMNPMMSNNLSSLAIYEVQFKCHTHFYMLAPSPTNPPTANIGDFVIVEADRGEDLGIITETLSKEALIEKRMNSSKLNPLAMRGESSSVIGKIKRIATSHDELVLPQKAMDEEQILQSVRELAFQKYHLPLTLHDCVYQFDRQKLTFFYSSEVRIDFREIVRELFTKYHTRIWMHEIPYESVPLIKFDNWASISLATGMKFAS